jgi:mRNA interferase RelE/StbE
VTYRIELTKTARRALTKDLPESVAVACWGFIRGPLAENPHRVGKPLRDQLEGWHSARRGEFRVIYQIFEGRVVVRVINIRHRRDAYRR